MALRRAGYGHVARWWQLRVVLRVRIIRIGVVAPTSVWGSCCTQLFMRLNTSYHLWQQVYNPRSVLCLCYAGLMTEHELSERIARLEERMKTTQAEYKTDMERISSDLRVSNERLRVSNERLSKELAQRDRAMLLAILGMIALAVAILKFA